MKSYISTALTIRRGLPGSNLFMLSFFTPFSHCFKYSLFLFSLQIYRQSWHWPRSSVISQNNKKSISPNMALWGYNSRWKQAALEINHKGSEKSFGDKEKDKIGLRSVRLCLASASQPLPFSPRTLGYREKWHFCRSHQCTPSPYTLSGSRLLSGRNTLSFLKHNRDISHGARWGDSNANRNIFWVFFPLFFFCCCYLFVSRLTSCCFWHLTQQRDNGKYERKLHI